MLTLGELLGPLREKVDPRELLGAFTPPDRFSHKSFDSYHPRHASQAAAATILRQRAIHLSRPSRNLFAFLKRRTGHGGGVYLDGGFGVGKTHLLAAFWNAAPSPKAYLSFDELMYFIGTAGSGQVGEYFEGYKVITVDEWELDDPGNLKMALAFLRTVLAEGVFVAVTSNTLPLELGAGRFSQKDFRLEVEELASSFEVVRVEGDDYRHRHFAARPTDEYFADAGRFEQKFGEFGTGGLRCNMEELLEVLGAIHPIRYRELARRISGLAIEGVTWMEDLSSALRWVHFIDSIYDARVPLVAKGSTALGEIFSEEALQGPYGKKLSRCLSRLEELMAESLGPGVSG